MYYIKFLMTNWETSCKLDLEKQISVENLVCALHCHLADVIIFKTIFDDSWINFPFFMRVCFYHLLSVTILPSPFFHSSHCSLCFCLLTGGGSSLGTGTLRLAHVWDAPGHSQVLFFPDFSLGQRPRSSLGALDK